jgi:hypothetical protein
MRSFSSTDRIGPATRAHFRSSLPWAARKSIPLPFEITRCFKKLNSAAADSENNLGGSTETTCTTSDWTFTRRRSAFARRFARGSNWRDRRIPAQRMPFKSCNPLICHDFSGFTSWLFTQHLRKVLETFTYGCKYRLLGCTQPHRRLLCEPRRLCFPSGSSLRHVPLQRK